MIAMLFGLTRLPPWAKHVIDALAALFFVAVIIGACLRAYDHSVIAKHDAAREAKAAPAREQAADERAADAATNTANEKDLHNAIDTAARAAPSADSLALLPMALLASACGNSAGFPPLADLKAATEPKPIPDDAIATDPAAEAHYNAAVEGWGDRVWSAGARLCRFYQRINMPGLTFCPPADKGN